MTQEKQNFLFLLQTYILASKMSPKAALYMMNMAINIKDECFNDSILVERVQSFTYWMTEPVSADSKPQWIKYKEFAR